jgi:hypothetical protein
VAELIQNAEPGGKSRQKVKFIMKKVIKGKVYDTETAKRLGEFEPTPYRADYHYYCETLYQKKTGEFFLHGEGNAASKYRRSCGQNEWCGGEQIQPLTYAEAQAWAEEYLGGEDYCEIFGEPDEGSEDVALNLMISAAVSAKLKKAAAQNGISLRAQVERWITAGK